MSTLQEIKSAIANLSPHDKALLTAELFAMNAEPDSASDSSGSRVAELQSRLASAGYYHGAIDGIMGPATRRAIRAYERDHGYVG